MSDVYQKIDSQEKKNNEKKITLEKKELENNLKRMQKEKIYLENAPKREEKRKAKECYRLRNEPPVRPVLEEIGNSTTHGLGALFAIVALVLLIIKSDTGFKLAGALVYGISMLIMMSMSCLYHAWPRGSKVKRIWRRFDYSSIYLLIGGTFAPLLLVNWNQIYGNNIGIILFAIQWASIITGITFVCIFGPGRIRWLHYTLYFVIGWSGLIFIPGWIKNDLGLFFMILGGGIVYTLGMIPFAKKKIVGAHFIWHFFVLAGAIVHFIGIFLFIY